MPKLPQTSVLIRATFPTKPSTDDLRAIVSQVESLGGTIKKADIRFPQVTDLRPSR